MQDEDELVGLEGVLGGEGLVLQRSQPYAWKIFHREDSLPVDNIHYRYLPRRHDSILSK